MLGAKVAQELVGHWIIGPTSQALLSKKLEELDGEVGTGGSPQPLNLLACHLENSGETSSFSFHGSLLMKRHFGKDLLSFPLKTCGLFFLQAILWLAQVFKFSNKMVAWSPFLCVCLHEVYKISHKTFEVSMTSHFATNLHCSIPTLWV
jgi:hypothetical protein